MSDILSELQIIAAMLTGGINIRAIKATNE
jgi:hypothetical protein